MTRFALFVASAAIAILAGGCGNKGTPADPPQDVKVTAGDSSVTVSWTMEPDVNYWIFYAPGDSVTTTNWSTIGGAAISGAVSPRLITGLTNGKTYSFTINGRRNGGPGGPGSPTQVAVPRLAGSVWTVGTPLGTGRLNGVTMGVLAVGAVYTAVGAGGTIYTSVSGGATTPATNPAAPADLNAVWYASAVGIVAAGAGGTVVSSKDGTTWTTGASGTSATLYGGTSNGINALVGVGAAGTIITGSDGSTWNVQTSGTTNDLFAAAFGLSRYVAVGANGTLLTSTDGATWQAVDTGTKRDLRGVAFGVLDPRATTPTNVFVAVGAAGTLLTSSDGLAWTLRPPISGDDFASVAFLAQFVAVGKSGKIYSSLDGITWTPQISGTTNDLRAVSAVIAGYAAVGESGTNLFSY